MFRFILFLLLFSAPCFSQTIISDYDDTLRISYGFDIDRSIKSYFEKTKYFVDYQYLFVNIWHGPKYLLSSSPSILLKKIKKDLNKNGIEVKQFISRTPKQLLNKKYKVHQLRNIILKTQGPVLLIGDDLHKDESVYQEILKTFPAKVLTYYIRNAQENHFSKNRYFYSLDIVLEEYFAKRLDLKDFIKFVDYIKKSSLDRINIKGYACPLMNLSNRKRAIISKLPGSLPQVVSEIYLSYSNDCKEKQFILKLLESDNGLNHLI